VVNAILCGAGPRLPERHHQRRNYCASPHRAIYPAGAAAAVKARRHRFLRRSDAWGAVLSTRCPDRLGLYRRFRTACFDCLCYFQELSGLESGTEVSGCPRHRFQREVDRWSLMR
jgi:hypothetical protein